MFDAKKFLNIIIGVVISILIGAALMILVYAIPNERAVKNINEGLQLYEREGNYPSWGLGEHSKLDNFTDAIMLLEIIHPIKNGVVNSAMLNPRLWQLKDDKPVDTLIKVMHDDITGLSEINYSRYWHGYLVILKPMLTVAKVNHVRMLLAYTDFILFVIVLLLLQKILGWKIALAFAATIMTLNLVSVSMSFQFSSIYVVTMLAIIFMLKKNRRLFDDKLYPYFFAAIGIAVAFTDFLTYPIFSVALPLIIFYLLNRRELIKEKISHVLKFMTGLLISWAIGYGGMWSGKWIIAQILTGENILMNALHQIMVHTQVANDLAQAGWNMTWFSAIQRNIAVLGHGPIRIFIFAAIIFLVYLLIHYRKKIIVTPKKILPYLLPAVLPFIWYSATSGHSHMHAFFTYRSLGATIFAIICIVIEILLEQTDSD